MKGLTLAVLTATCLGAAFLLAEAPANACTPHPDNPDGCNNWPPRRVKVEDLKLKKPFPGPGPVCLSCPSHVLPKDQLIQKETLVTEPTLNQQLDRSVIEAGQIHHR